jgi:hypothetical protein
MMRTLYCCLVRLHPRPFRERFEEEMLCAFDDTATKAGALWLFWDATLSLSRQWVLRPQRWMPLTKPLPSSSNAIPLFAIFQEHRPHPLALVCGGMLSLIFFAGIVAVAQWSDFAGVRDGRPVVDKTGLRGFFNFKLQWSPEGLPPQPLGPDGAGPVAPSDPSGQPSLFTALQEQMGLRLESQTAPIEFIVIENIERPTEN